MISQDVTNRPGEYAMFVVYEVKDTPETKDKIKYLCDNLSAFIRSAKNRFSPENISCVMGFGAHFWNKYFSEFSCPKELKVFEEIKGDKYTAVSTPGDLLLHIRGKSVAVCYELLTIINKALSGVVASIDEVHGFRYFDGRSIIGFVDGTENPAVDDTSARYAIIGDEDEKFKGGSYVFVQKYLHDMQAWESLPVEEQEKVIGRRKFNDVELTDAEKPKNAHNAVTNIQDKDGNDIKIVRANMPFANPSKGEVGTYFIGYARTFEATKKMLLNMFIGDPIGNTDRLLDFSTAVTGTLFFVPSYDLLSELSE